MYFCILAAILIVLATYILFFEPFRGTRIFRGVGTLNDADEIPVAAGIINSSPLFDYTYTYWDGAKLTSCDDCASSYICPQCPQFVQIVGEYNK